MNVWVLAAVAAGGALGSVARFGLAGVFQPAGGAFPIGIMSVNIIGSFLMGVIVELSALKLNLSPELRAFLTVGVLGGFTTFSTFSLDTVLLIQRAAPTMALLYLAGSVFLSILALCAGLWVVRLL